jgi:hypothetical protein
MKIKEILSDSNTAYFNFSDRNWAVCPTSPLKERRIPRIMNKE